MAKENEKDARAPDSVEESNIGEARQGEVRRGKTRDAFAFRNFDKTRILQRNFCSNKNPVMLDFCDDAFLEHMCEPFANNSDFVDMRCGQIKEITLELRKYYKRMLKHLSKLGEISIALAKKIASSNEENKKWRSQYRRTNDLINKYESIGSFFIGLIDKSNKCYKKLDDKRKKIYRKEFAGRLRLARTVKDYSQGYIANELGLTVGAYQFYERGQREPNLTNLIRLSKILDVTLEWLILGQDDISEADIPHN